MPSPATADRNLLFGILALQLDFINRDQLVAGMHGWVLDKAKPLGDILVTQKALAADRRQLLDALVAEHVRQHGGDVQKSLAAVSMVAPVVHDDLKRVADPDLGASLGQLPPPGSLSGATIAGAPMPSWQAPDGPARFRILRPHARGGLGEVFVAEDSEFGRQVALKEIQERHSRNQISKSRFMVEAEITGQLEHPGIVPVYALGNHPDGRPYYAMRFVRGDNMHGAIKRFHTQGPVNAAAFVSLEFRGLLRRFIDVCNAMAYAHSRGVLHRDLKPGNIMVGQFGETLVVDWGLAKITGKAPEGPPSEAGPETTVRPRSGGDSSATVAGQALGTPAYMSPEQAAGRLDDLGPATDIYSLGATLFELLTGKMAFEGPLGEVLGQIQRGEFPRPRQVNAAIPPAMEAICLKAMAVRPGQRYTTALDLAAEIDHWLGDEPVVAYPEPLAARARRWARKHRTAVSVGAWLLATTVVGLALGLFAVERERQHTEEQRQIADEQRQRAEEQHQLAEERRAEADRARALADEVISKMTDKDMLNALVSQDRLLPQQLVFLKDVGRYYEQVAPPGLPAKDVKARAALFFNQAAIILSKNNRPAEAEAAVRRAIEIYKPLAADHPTESFGQSLARCYVNLGRGLQQQNRHDESKAAIDQAIAVLDTLVARSPGNADLQQTLSDARNNLGFQLRKLGRPADAESYVRSAIEGQKKLQASAPKDPKRRARLGLFHHNLGHVLWAQQRADEAIAAYRTSAEIYKALAADFPQDLGIAYELAMVYSSLGNAAAEGKNLAAAETEYRQSLTVLKGLSTVAKHRLDAAYCYRNLGEVLVKQGKIATAADMAEACAELTDAEAKCQYRAASILALCAAADDGEADDRYAKRAVELFRIAIVRGFSDFAHLLDDPDFEALRQRDDFAMLLHAAAEGMVP